MKISEAYEALSEKAEAGDTTALAAIVLASRVGYVAERLEYIDGALAEIRNTLQAE